MKANRLAASVVRPATVAEVAAVRSAIELLPDSDAADLVVVFCYPGPGVGERHPQLAGCTSQLLQISAARATLEPLGIGVFTLSTKPTRRDGLADAVRAVTARVDAEQAMLLPHVEVDDDELYLQRTTFLLRTDGPSTAVSGISDSAEHVARVVDHLVALRLATFGAGAGDPAPEQTEEVSADAGSTDHQLLPRGAD